jgi:hypothetical protein
MADEWFYTQNGQQCGPVDFSQLQGLASSGSIHPNDLIWKQGMPNWAAAGTVTGVFGAAPSSPQPPPQAYAPPPPAQQGFPQPGGYPLNYPQIQQSSPHIGMAITSMVLSLIGLLCLGIITGPLGIIFGAIALSGMNKSGDNRGRGMAVTGLVVGILDIFFGIAWFMYFLNHRHH